MASRRDADTKGKTSGSKKHPLYDRTMMCLSGLGPCAKCKRQVGTIGFWLGSEYGKGVTCDRCALGWIEREPISEAEAMSRYGLMGDRAAQKQSAAMQKQSESKPKQQIDA